MRPSGETGKTSECLAFQALGRGFTAQWTRGTLLLDTPRLHFLVEFLLLQCPVIYVLFIPLLLLWPALRSSCQVSVNFLVH